MSEPWDKEAIYDERISPLVAQIIAICKEHDLPFVGQFQIADDADNGPFYCTTVIDPPNASDQIRKLRSIVKPQHTFVALTMTSTPNGPAAGGGT